MIKYEIDKYYYSELYDSKIKVVNIIIGNLFDKKLVEKIFEINVNQKIRKFDFLLFINKIKKYKI